MSDSKNHKIDQTESDPMGFPTNPTERALRLAKITQVAAEKVEEDYGLWDHILSNNLEDLIQLLEKTSN